MPTPTPGLSRCRRCGRQLTDPASKERGYGSDCWQLLSSTAHVDATRRERLHDAHQVIVDGLDRLGASARTTAGTVAARVWRRLQEGKPITKTLERSLHYWEDLIQRGTAPRRERQA